MRWEDIYLRIGLPSGLMAHGNSTTVTDRDRGSNPGKCRHLGFRWDPGPGQIPLPGPGFSIETLLSNSAKFSEIFCEFRGGGGGASILMYTHYMKKPKYTYIH